MARREGMEDQRVDRRTYLKLAGILVLTGSVEPIPSQFETPDDVLGYGQGGYGRGGYGDSAFGSSRDGDSNRSSGATETR